MSFVEVQFPTGIAMGATGGAEFSTDVTALYSGHEKRNANWSSARCAWNVAHGVKSKADYENLIAFFRARQGKAIGFRFKDWMDYEVTGGNIGTGDGSTTDFQLRKQYNNGSVTVNRTITKPVSGTISIYVDEVEQTETTDYTIDVATGIVTFTSPPANESIITADFEFDVPVRFDTDKLDMRMDHINIASWGNIPIIEVRV